MRPSTTLRKAPEMGIVQFRGSFGHYPKLCAVGAMCYVAGIGRDYTEDYQNAFGVDFFYMLPMMMMPLDYPGRLNHASLFDVVTWMNDVKKMDFEEIADWLESVGL